MQEQTKQSLWPTRLQAQAESGRTIRAWCADNGVTEATFHYWRNRLAATAARAAVHRASDCVSERARVGGGDAQWLPRTPGHPAHVEWLGAVLAVLR